MELFGAYTCDRAAALSGVPRSKIYRLAQQRIVVPSVSASRVKLWSFTDLLALRAVYWLRHRNKTGPATDSPVARMQAVRQVLEGLRLLSARLYKQHRPTVLVDDEGNMHVDTSGGRQELEQQVVTGTLLDLIAPFGTVDGSRGPDLHCPRSELRIVPGKLSGSPHVAGTRVETRALAALAREGYEPDAIGALYPYLDGEQIAQALDLEAQLSKNLSGTVAA